MRTLRTYGSSLGLAILSIAAVVSFSRCSPIASSLPKSSFKKITPSSSSTPDDVFILAEVRAADPSTLTTSKLTVSAMGGTANSWVAKTLSQDEIAQLNSFKENGTLAIIEPGSISLDEIRVVIYVSESADEIANRNCKTVRFVHAWVDGNATLQIAKTEPEETLNWLKAHTTSVKTSKTTKDPSNPI